MPTKLGLHVTFGGRDGFGDVVAQAPAVVTSVDQEVMAETKQKSNGRTVTIFRTHTDENGLFKDAPPGIDHMSIEEARQAADKYWPALKAKYRQNRADYYQVTNETGGDEPKSLANIIAFEARLMELAEADEKESGERFKLAIGSPAGGSPGSWELWVKFFVPHIIRAGQGGHIYSRHAYGGVQNGETDCDKGINGFLTKVVDGKIVAADANTGRPFREAAYLRRHGINTPIVLTEAGPNGGYCLPGNHQEFLDDVIRYDKLCQEHENIWGFCLWTYGNYQNRPANIEVVSDQLAVYLKTQGGADPKIYPPPGNGSVAGPPGGNNGSDIATPRPVTHIVHLLPQDTTLPELKRLVAFLHESRATYTYSADAAQAIVYAGSEQSHVVVWSGSRWQDDIFGWLHQRGISSLTRKFSDIESEVAPGALTLAANGVKKPQPLNHTVQLLPPDTDQAAMSDVATDLHRHRSTFTFSADAAHALIYNGSENSQVFIWSGERWDDDIFAWFRQRHVPFTKKKLTTGERGFKFTHWPSDTFRILQRYDARPEVYKQYCWNGRCLTGHDGIDIAAPYNAPVYAVAAGKVERRRYAEEPNNNYGNAIYIRHSDGYQTVYAHLKEFKVEDNQIVTGGQVIGMVGNTGNVEPKPTLANLTAGAHLHLTLKKDGATHRGETDQPFDIIDPTPFLELLDT